MHFKSYIYSDKSQIIVRLKRMKAKILKGMLQKITLKRSITINNILRDPCLVHMTAWTQMVNIKTTQERTKVTRNCEMLN